MVNITSDTAALIAQLVSVIVFASVVELRKAFMAQPFLPIRLAVAMLFASGSVISGWILFGLVDIVAHGGASVDAGGSLEGWILTQFVAPLVILVVAMALRYTGDKQKQIEKAREELLEDSKPDTTPEQDISQPHP